MFKHHHLELLLEQAFQDRRLDDDEKHALFAYLENATVDERRFARNRAFDFVHHVIEEKGENVRMSLRWLEKVVKTIDRAGPNNRVAEAHFSPGKGCCRAILEQCFRAKYTIDVCVFTISDNRLSEGLIAAHQRDVQVRILTDNQKSEDRGSDIDLLQAEGITVKMDASKHHMHHKFAIFDQSILINGSFNWTRSATEKNQENILVTGDERLVGEFQDKFDELWRKFNLA